MSGASIIAKISVSLMAIVCVIANFVFKLTINAVFPKIVVYRANFPNLKGPRAPSQNCKKKIPVLL